MSEPIPHPAAKVSNQYRGLTIEYMSPNIVSGKRGPNDMNQKLEVAGEETARDPEVNDAWLIVCWTKNTIPGIITEMARRTVFRGKTRLFEILVTAKISTKNDVDSIWVNEATAMSASDPMSLGLVVE